MTNPAPSVARSKELHPERYCAYPRCLWRLPDGLMPRLCPRHQGWGLVPLSDRDEEDAEHTEAVSHREDYA
jgi:hypothetical protein